MATSVLSAEISGVNSLVERLMNGECISTCIEEVCEVATYAWVRASLVREVLFHPKLPFNRLKGGGGFIPLFLTYHTLVVAF